VLPLCGTATYTAEQMCHYGKVKNYFTDARDNKKYPYVTIGTGATAQTWMAENLSYNATGSKCYAEGVSGVSADSIAKNCDTYGRLYDWATAMNNSASSDENPSGRQGVCPSGWHLPSDAEWGALMQFVGTSCTSTSSPCADAGTKLKANSALWRGNGNGTDDFGFSALPGGYRNFSGFYSVGSDGYWQSSSQYDASNAYFRYIMFGSADIGRGNYDKASLYSVRCAKNKN